MNVGHHALYHGHDGDTQHFATANHVIVCRRVRKEREGEREDRMTVWED